MKILALCMSAIVVFGFSGGVTQAQQCDECPGGLYLQTCCGCFIENESSSTMRCSCLNTNSSEYMITQIDVSQCESNSIINNNGNLQCTTTSGGTLPGTPEGVDNSDCGWNAALHKRFDQTPKK